MGGERQLSVKKNERGKTTNYFCSHCSWILPYSRVSTTGTGIPPEQLAAIFFKVHGCEGAPPAEEKIGEDKPGALNPHLV